MTRPVSADEATAHLALLIGGFRRLGLNEPMSTYPFRVLHPDATEQDTYEEVVADLGWDPSCVHGADRCAGEECCCVETHGSAFRLLLHPTRSA